MVLRRRSILWIVAGVVVVVLGIIGYVFSGSSAIESWVGTQLLEIGGSYLRPELKFEHLTYLRPRTILLDNLTLSSPDPRNPGHSVVILAVKRARLELTEIPRRGQPIRFSEVRLESPEIYAIAAAPGGTSMVGFSNLLKDSNESQASGGGSAEGGGGKGTKPAPMTLSDFLQIRHLEIIDGKISYDPRLPGRPPIWLDGINANLAFAPAGGSATPGLYTIATTIFRKPAFELDMQGQLNIDTLTLELAKFALSLDLREKNAHFLPPDLQSVLKSGEVAGQLRITATGQLPLTSWRQATLHSQGELTAARVAVGQTRLSVKSWNWEANLAGGVATIVKSEAHLLGGDLRLTGTIPLDGAAPAQLALHANQLQIQQMIRSSNPGDVPLYAGNLAAEITFSAPLSSWNKQAAGGGTFSIQQGRIDHIPVLGSIITSLNRFLTKTLNFSNHGLTDTANGAFTFAGNCVRFARFAGTAGALALRGTGTVGFDGRLDLRLNAGPMERLQNSLGAIGQIWASISDAMAAYQVTGTVDDPQVSMELGGSP